MISKITHPSFKSIYVQDSAYNRLTPENKTKMKNTVEFLEQMYSYSNDIVIFNNAMGDICYHIQGAHPSSIMLHPEVIKHFKDPEQVKYQVLLSLVLTMMYNNIYSIKMPFTRGTIKNIDNKTTKEVGMQIIEDVEEFNRKNPQKGYIA